MRPPSPAEARAPRASSAVPRPSKGSRAPGHAQPEPAPSAATTAHPALRARSTRLRQARRAGQQADPASAGPPQSQSLPTRFRPAGVRLQPVELLRRSSGSLRTGRRTLRGPAAPRVASVALVDARTLRRIGPERLVLVAFALLAILWLVVAMPSMAHAAPMPTPVPTPTPSGDVSVKISGPGDAPSTSITVLIAITLLSIAPALLLMMSSFTKIFVVLAMTRNALGLNTIPPTQVLAGLAMFLSIFIMWPVLDQVNHTALTPFLDGKLEFDAALGKAAVPLQHFMLQHTRESDIALMARAANQPNPASPETTPFFTVVPAFMLSELRGAFIIGLVVFVPFLVIDLVVSSGLMAMGMMMLPPTMIALPFKILLFVLVDGWGLIITALVQSYNT